MCISIHGMFKAQHTVITLVIGYNSKTALTVHNFHSPRSIPCRAAYHGATDIHVLLNTYLSHPTGFPFIHRPGLRAAMCQINCLAEGQKCRAMMVALVDIKIYACSIILLFILILLFLLVLVFERFDISKLGCCLSCFTPTAQFKSRSCVIMCTAWAPMGMQALWRNTM